MAAEAARVEAERRGGVVVHGGVGGGAAWGGVLGVAVAAGDRGLRDGGGVVDHAVRVFALLEVLAAFTVPAWHRAEHVLPGNAPNEPVAVEDGQRALHAADAQTRRA